MDTIGDMLTRIRNAGAVRHETVKLPYSNLKWAIAQTLLEEKFLAKAEKKGRKDRRIIELTLKYVDGEPAIRELRRISKPGRRVYVKKASARSRRAGRIYVLSTPKGIMTSKKAIAEGVGGEVLFEIW